MGIKFNIDQVILEGEHKLKIIGWVFSNKEKASIKIIGGEILKEERIKRIDVKSHFGNLVVDEDCGFEIISELKYNKMKLIFTTSKEKTSFIINLRKIKFIHKIQKIKKIAKKISRENMKEGIKYYKKYGFKLTLKKIKNFTYQDKGEMNYNEWFLTKHLPPKEKLEEQKKIKFEYSPKISIVTPTFNTPQKFLIEMIESVRNQTYSNWELCLADGASTNDETIKLLKEYEKKDNRIKVKYLNQNLMISGNTNEALKLANGDYIGLFDHDDLLTPNCLFEVVKAINEDKEREFIYTDEDKTDENTNSFFGPHFKQDWALYTLRSYNYITHFSVFSKKLLEKTGVFRSEFDGAQDYDIILRLTEKAKKIYHIPKVLYHWRVHKNSTASNPEAKLYAYEAGKKAIESHLIRNKIKFNKVENGEFLGIYKVDYKIEEAKKISIVIPNKDHIADLKKCIESIMKKTNYENYEIIVVENNSVEEETFEYYKHITSSTSKIKVIYWKEKGFNYSKLNNFALSFIESEYMILLNNDTEVINKNWLEEMLMLCQQKDVGIVGAKLYYPDKTIQHAGVVVGLGGVAGHIYEGFTKQDYGHAGRLQICQNMSAVTAACLMIKTSIYKEVNGLEENLFKVAYNDIDLCLKVINKGYLIVWTPFAELYHYESKSRGYEDNFEKIERFNKEKTSFIKKWKEYIEKGDPYYNKNLTLDRGDFSLKF